MNADRMIGMAIRMIMRKLMRRGISAGTDAATKGKTANGPDGRKTARNAGRTLRFMRRIGRF